MMYDVGCKLEAKSDWSGYKDTNWDNFSTALKNAGKACREVCPEAQIIIHTEQVGNTPLVTDYYKRLQQYDIDYDIIGTSYYPYYHGNLTQLNKTLTAFETQFPSKKIMVVETGCSYREKVGDNNQGYPLTYEGQRQFTADLITTLKSHQNVNGLFWWFPEANEYGLNWYTERVTDGWYNAGLFDNKTGQALPALYELKNFSGGSTRLSYVTLNGTDDDYWYTISGIRSISVPSKPGLFIHNGQKVTIR
jgi:arabinogalactan endo-1,4-beta-galactosidase